VGRHQFIGTLLLRPCRSQICYRVVEGALRVFQGGIVRRRVNLVKHLALLHLAAFLEEPFLHDAGNPCIHRRHTERRGAPGQVLRQGHRCRGNREHADLQRSSGDRLRGWPAAREERTGQGNEGQRSGHVHTKSAPTLSWRKGRC